VRGVLVERIAAALIKSAGRGELFDKMSQNFGSQLRPEIDEA
jgi:hypothetical protein